MARDRRGPILLYCVLCRWFCKRFWDRRAWCSVGNIRELVSTCTIDLPARAAARLWIATHRSSGRHSGRHSALASSRHSNGHIQATDNSGCAGLLADWSDGSAPAVAKTHPAPSTSIVVPIGFSISILPLGATSPTGRRRMAANGPGQSTLSCAYTQKHAGCSKVHLLQQSCSLGTHSVQGEDASGESSQLAA